MHCVAGINRSGVLVAAARMLDERTSVLATVKHCRAQRGSTFLWNESFQEQLVALARREGQWRAAATIQPDRCGQGRRMASGW